MNFHIHPTAVAFFIIGLALHALAQADGIARSKNNQVTSRWAVFRAYWVTLAVRGAICIAIFILWLQGQLAEVLMALGVPIPDSLAAVMNLHVGGAIGFMAGYAFDSLLGYIPRLNTSVPPAIDVPSAT